MDALLIWFAVLAIFVFVTIADSFIRWTERRDARDSVREIQALRKMTAPAATKKPDTF